MSIDTELLAEEAYSRLAACADHASRMSAAARVILAVYDDFYSQLCEYPHRAQRAFAPRDGQPRPHQHRS